MISIRSLVKRSTVGFTESRVDSQGILQDNSY